MVLSSHLPCDFYKVFVCCFSLCGFTVMRINFEPKNSTLTGKRVLAYTDANINMIG